MTSSAFTPSVLTISSGGTSGSGQGELNVVTNPSAATDTSGWTASTPANLSRDSSGSPLDPVVATGFSVVSTLAGQTLTSASLTVPAGLRNRKLKLEFYMTQATAAWKVDVLNSSGTRFPLTTDSGSPLASNLPALSSSGKYTTYFDMDSGSSIQVRFTSTAGSGTLKFTQAIVGPGIQPQGAVVGEWQGFTPTITGLSIGNGTRTGKYRRVGNNMEIRVGVTFGTTTSQAGGVFLSIPLGLTLDTSVLPTSISEDTIVGEARIWDLNTIGLVGQTAAASSSSLTTIKLMGPASTVSHDYVIVTGTSPFTFGSGDGYTFDASVPIAEWAGSGTVQLAQNDVEYAYNASTSTTTSDTTSFGYGPQGALIQNITAVIDRTVQFQTPIQPSDIITIEMLPAGANATWIPAAKVAGVDISLANQNGVAYGIGIFSTNSSNNQVTVRFGTYSYNISTYGAVGSTWASYGGNFRWRVRKSSAGAAVGFGIADTQSAGLVRNRSAWTNLTTADLTVTASGGGSVTIEAGDIEYFKWKLIDDCVLIAFKLRTISVSGVVNAILITLPTSVPAPSAEAVNACVVYDNSGASSVPGLVSIGSTRVLYLSKASGAFTASTNNSYIYGQIMAPLT